MKTLGSLALGIGLTTLVLGFLNSDSTWANPSAQTCDVPGDFTFIQDALNDSSCDSIVVGSGTFTENLEITRTVEIMGQGEAETTIDGNEAGRVFVIQPGVVLTLSHLTVANGLSPNFPGSGRRQPGAGIYAISSTLHIGHTTITNNVAAYGSGIYLEDSLARIDGSTISANKEARYGVLVGGGGLFIYGDSSVVVYNTLFSDNSCHNGGGIRIAAGSLMISNTLFLGNHSDVGGALHNGPLKYQPVGGVVQIVNSDFMSNSADYGGSAINNDYGSIMNIVSTTISANIGVGALSNTGLMTLTQSIVEGNGRTGVSNNGIMAIENSVVSDNEGRGIYNTDTLTITESLLSGNFGAIENNCGNHTLSIFNTDIVSNFGGSGGAIHNYFGTTIVSNTMISNNTASDRGGAIALNSGTVHVQNSTMTKNRSNNDGGAVSSDNNGEMVITNSTISENSAEGYGGAVFNDSDSRIFLSNSTFYKNRSDSNKQGTSFHFGWNWDSVFEIVNSIVQGEGTLCGGQESFTSLGTNIFSDMSCDPIQSDLANINVGLFPLSYNNGLGLIYQLIPNSAAIDAANTQYCPAADQQGTPRPIDGDMDSFSICDIGSYEFDPANPPELLSLYLPAIIDQ